MHKLFFLVVAIGVLAACGDVDPCEDACDSKSDFEAGACNSALVSCAGLQGVAIVGGDDGFFEDCSDAVLSLYEKSCDDYTPWYEDVAGFFEDNDEDAPEELGELTAARDASECGVLCLGKAGSTVDTTVSTCEDAVNLCDEAPFGVETCKNAALAVAEAACKVI